MKIIVEKKNDNYIIPDKSDNYGIVPPLYFGQMTYRNKNGEYLLSCEVPENYFKKADFLQSKGWYRCYHYNLWIHKDNDRDYGMALGTDDVLAYYYPEFKLQKSSENYNKNKL